MHTKFNFKLTSLPEKNTNIILYSTEEVQRVINKNNLFCPYNNARQLLNVPVEKLLIKTNRSDKRKMQAAEMRFLRPTVGHTLLDKKRSRDIREQLGIFNINNKLTQYKIKWKEHIQRMDDNRLTNSMAYGTRRFNAAFTRALQ